MVNLNGRKPNSFSRSGRACRVSAGLFVLLAVAVAAGAAEEWLAICGKCPGPTVFSRSGIGTSNAVAEARLTRAELERWCDSFEPDDKTCVTHQLAEWDTTKIYRATADCAAGSIQPIDGKTYTFAGIWSGSDFADGRSKWRDKSGSIVPTDDASGGLSISQQWEVLCPHGKTATPSSSASSARKPTPAAEPTPEAAAKPLMGASKDGNTIRFQLNIPGLTGR